MITPNELRSIWDNLLQKLTHDGVLVPTQTLEEPILQSGKPVLAIDREKRKHLLLPIAETLQASSDRRSEGVQILINVWNQRESPLRVVDVVCNKPHLTDLFDQIIIDILERIREVPGRPDKVAGIVLNRWRELLVSESGDVPDKTAIIGLLGELTILQRMQTISHSAINTWTGPNGTRHDFSGSRMVIEVKSTLQRQGLMITINGVDQLIPPEDSQLILAIVRFEEAPADGISISEIVEALRTDGIDYIALMTKISKIGFTPRILLLTKEIRFRLLEIKFYEVENDFPRIVPQSFVGGSVPPGILAVVYKVDLTTQPPFPLDVGKTTSILHKFLGEALDAHSA